MEDDLITYLETITGVTDIVGSGGSERIYVNRIPQGTALPALVLTRIFDDYVQHMTAQSGLAQTMMQVDSYAEKSKTAQDLAEAVRAALDGYTSAATNAIGSANVRRVSLTNETASYEPTVDGSDVFTHRLSQDYEIWHEVTVPTF